MKCLLDYYLFKMKRHRNDLLCDTCGVNETVEHFIMQYRNNNELIRKLKSACSLQKSMFHLNRMLSVAWIQADGVSFSSVVVVCCRCHRERQASGRRWDCSGLGRRARRCCGIKCYSDACMGHGTTRDSDTMVTAMRTTAVLLGFLNLTNMPCPVLPWQAAWQVILMFKLISSSCTPGHKQNGDTGGTLHRFRFVVSFVQIRRVFAIWARMECFQNGIVYGSRPMLRRLGIFGVSKHASLPPLLTTRTRFLTLCGAPTILRIHFQT